MHAVSLQTSRNATQLRAPFSPLLSAVIDARRPRSLHSHAEIWADKMMNGGEAKSAVSGGEEEKCDPSPCLYLNHAAADHVLFHTAIRQASILLSPPPPPRFTLLMQRLACCVVWFPGKPKSNLCNQ